ncbi:MAG: GspE/PulE family protein, partial [Phycisphaerae bacterium]
MSSEAPRIRLGDALLKAGVINEQQLTRALAEQARTNRMLGELLIEQGVITPHVFLETLATTLGVRCVHLRHGLIDPQVFKLVGAEECERLRVVPMFKVRDRLTVAMAEPQSLPTIDRLRTIANCKIRPVLALEPNILEFVKKYSCGDVNVDAFLTSLAESDLEVVERESVDEGPATDLDKLVAGSPIINLVNVALLTAVRDGASDIHIEPDRKGTRIRYRVDGVLRDLMKPPPG